MLQTVIWQPPTLCGCQFRITADWPEKQEAVTYRHPLPFTIQKIELVNVCDDHKEAMLQMPDTSGLFDIDGMTGQLVQKRGYLRYPIENPTPAEILYTYFYFHKGQVRSFPCGCSGYQHIAPDGTVQYLVHPKRTGKCFIHTNDTDEMDDAEWDFAREVAATPESK